jgi:hypothetical protein
MDGMRELRVGHDNLGCVVRCGEDCPRLLRVMLEMKVDDAVERERAVGRREDKVGRWGDHSSIRAVEFCKSKRSKWIELRVRVRVRVRVRMRNLLPSRSSIYTFCCNSICVLRGRKDFKVR